MIVVVGQAPSKTGERKKPFEGPGGDRLARAMGLSNHAELRERAVVVNLLRRWPGAARKGDLFPIDRAARAAKRLVLPKQATLLLVGKGVARAFGVDAEFFASTIARGYRAFVVPHPSGVSLWWNDPRNRLRATRRMRAIFRAHG